MNKGFYFKKAWNSGLGSPKTGHIIQTLHHEAPKDIVVLFIPGHVEWDVFD